VLGGPFCNKHIFGSLKYKRKRQSISDRYTGILGVEGWRSSGIWGLEGGGIGDD
jgi:hypothetical protein